MGVEDFHGDNFQFWQIHLSFLPIILREGIMPPIVHKAFIGVIIADGRGKSHIQNCLRLCNVQP